MDGKWVEMFPSGRKYRVIGGLDEKSEDPLHPTRDGIYVDVYYHEDSTNSNYYLRVASCDVGGDEPEWEKYYEFGQDGLVEVENLHFTEGNPNDVGNPDVEWEDE
jgi:hypothetical protein